MKYLLATGQNSSPFLNSGLDLLCFSGDLSWGGGGEGSGALYRFGGTGGGFMLNKKMHFAFCNNSSMWIVRENYAFLQSW